jgi:uncharacterized membrane protein
VPRIEEHIDIDARQPEVFRFVHNTDKRPEWDEQVGRVEVLTPGPVRQGTLLRVDATTGGTVFTWDGEIIAYQFPNRSRVRVMDAASSSPFTRGSELAWEFSPAGTGTRFTWIWEYQLGGIVARIRNRLGGQAAAQRAIRSSLRNLKETMESMR